MRSLLPVRHARYGWLVVLLLLLPVPALAQGADSSALDSAREKIEAVEAELEDARADREEASATLEEADERLSRLEEAVNEVARALDEQEVEVQETRRRVVTLEGEIAAQRAAFAERAVSMYKKGASASLDAVLSAGSIDDALDRGSYVQAISSSDQANLEQISSTRVSLDAERVRLAEERDRLASMKAEREQLLVKVRELRTHRELQLAAARANVSDLEERKEDLEEESERIEELIKQRESTAPVEARVAATGSASRVVDATGYAWPRCDTVTSEFGYRWGRRHEGLDIDGNSGDPIYAAKDGVVIFAGWQGGYGRMTLIEHGDGVVTAYAHQTSQAVGSGQHVSRGEYIGSIGTTGSVTGSHLHFETRVNGSAVNPRRFLPSSC